MSPDCFSSTGVAVGVDRGRVAMEEKEVFNQVSTVVVAQFGVAPNSVSMAMSFTKDLGADAVALMDLWFAIEEEFGMEIPDADQEEMTTVGEAVTYIHACFR